MIWIVTLCLLATFAWFLFNGINERRWVEAHSHDEAVARDEGFLPSFSSVRAKVAPDAEGKVSIREEDSRFARAVAKVQEKTARAGGYLEQKAAAARGDGGRVDSVREEDSFFARASAKVGEVSGRVGEKLDERLARERTKTSRDSAETGAPVATDDGVFGRAVAKVAEKNESLERRAAERAKRRAEERRDKERTAAGSDAPEGGFFDRMVDRVGTQSARLDAKLDERARRARESTDGSAARDLDGDDDFLSRVSAKVGRRINEADERIVAKSRELVNRDKRSGTDGTGAPTAVTSAPAPSAPSDDGAAKPVTSAPVPPASDGGAGPKGD